ncbi:UDP-N-acetylmuramoyl-tripeptide--D-alanyl-D-alanine ligase [Rubrobacter marinus]|uniref:UDP-N-acetylmuramoyl-tripeptide--D-alanyl-D-alanine ligase n=1 Tax=Rubrobacter marinus TaxID=2653852 RepID=A0A6G8PXB1_9ACTN|nr:UDP-N-acetylmuramoyl-tripeptide--D-alanyl-D-alanine ligase [Rubrobacter marinus]QIN78825.1 UDP-N-acetylmuramoyl-tripeptide--D-alanyl-D-alanine ligase [Rubrobacter marinus]
MRPVSLERAAEAMAGTLHDVANGRAEAPVCGAAVDSRAVREGHLFFAMRGQVDGADFAPEAMLRGATAVVCDRPLSVPTVVVNDVQAALGELARWSLAREGAPTVVGITGSVGKTTVKDALAAILRSTGRRIAATEGNYNNEIGLPLTVLAADEKAEVLVLEMGATHPGDIAHLSRIAPPEVGILTAVSPVHLDSFGSLEALAATKGELAMSLGEGPESVLVCPIDAPAAATGPGREIGRRITFGRKPEADLYASGVAEQDGGLSFTLHMRDQGREIEVKAPVFGTHLVEPLLAAIGGGLALGLEPEECARGLTRLRRTGLRGEVYKLREDIIVYDDSYNASPAAVAAVLRYGAEGARRQDRRLVAVLGGMFELGGAAREYHREAGRLAAEVGVDLLVCVGDEARWYAEAFPKESLFYESAEAAAAGLERVLKEGDYVVVKGSRGVGLDRLTRKLKERLALV